MKRIIIAAGGTGGHLFPAQALADDLLESGRGVEVFFAGAGLKTNRYFQREKYPFRDVESGTVFRRHPVAILKAVGALIKGIVKSFWLIHQVQPDLVVGFGSFHSFPILLAALLKGVPLTLFESNAIPGKVNRFFSRWSKLTAIVFSHARAYLKGNVAEVEMPLRKPKHQAVVEESHAYFGLNRDLPTLLIFGGSQGAAKLNRFFVAAVEQMVQNGLVFQVIHLLGKQEGIEQVRLSYKELKVAAAVKEFEGRMDLAYQVATLAISRSGAATITELLAFEIPSILIPFPHAADDHQKKNAEFLDCEVGGAIHFRESELSASRLHQEIALLLQDGRRKKMKEALSQFNKRKKRVSLCSLICQLAQTI